MDAAGRDRGPACCERQEFPAKEARPKSPSPIGAALGLRRFPIFISTAFRSSLANEATVPLLTFSGVVSYMSKPFSYRAILTGAAPEQVVDAVFSADSEIRAKYPQLSAKQRGFWLDWIRQAPRRHDPFPEGISSDAFRYRCARDGDERSSSMYWPNQIPGIARPSLSDTRGKAGITCLHRDSFRAPSPAE